MENIIETLSDVFALANGAVELKRLNLQNMQLSLKVAELLKENQALKDKLAQMIIAKEKDQCN